MRIRHFLVVIFFAPVVAVGQVPQNLEATAGDRQVSLEWTAPEVEEGDSLTCYRVYRDTTSIPDDTPSDFSDLRVAELEPFEGGRPSYTDSGLSNGTKYFYRVTAEIGETGDGPLTCGGSNTDESSFSNQATATPFAPTVLQITSPEVPVSQPVDAGRAVDVTVEGTNVPSDETVRLRYRQGGEASFNTVTMAQNGTEFTASIPGATVTARGVEYVVTTRDEGGDAVRTPSEGVASVRVNSETLSFTQPGGTAQTAYRMVTYPGQLNDPQLSNLFGVLTPYDPTEWRLFAIGSEGLTADGGYVERNELGTELGTGEGLWFISRSGATLGPIQGTSLRTDQPFEIPLREGWNLIGNPFAFEVPVSQLRVTNSAGTLQDIFGYDGTFVPKSEGDLLEPYRGYLVRLSNGQAGTLVIDPAASPPSSTSLSARPRAQWTVDVSVRVGQARDQFNTFGAAPGAGDGVDPADGREPPPVGDYVSLAFQPPTHNRALWRDLRGTGQALRTWTADVRTTVSGTATLTVKGVESVPEGQDVWLVDPALGLSQNLRENPRYQFPVSGDEQDRHVRFLVGSPAEVQRALGKETSRPERVRLLPSAPNPVQGQATLRYAVPSQMRVTLELYDFLGRRVATLVEDRMVQAGTHSYVWAPGAGGERVSSGTYLLRLRAGEETRTRKIVVVQ
jgi:hypothetical protein